MMVSQVRALDGSPNMFFWGKKKKAENKEPKKVVKYIVVFDKDMNKWRIKKTHAGRAIDSFNTKQEAVARAKELGKNQDKPVNVKRKRDGKFGKV